MGYTGMWTYNLPPKDPKSDMRVFLNRKCGKKKRGK